VGRPEMLRPDIDKGVIGLPARQLRGSPSFVITYFSAIINVYGYISGPVVMWLGLITAAIRYNAWLMVWGVVMMGGKSSLMWTWLVVITCMVLLLVSCSQVSPSPNIQSSPVDESSPDTASPPKLVDTTINPTTTPETLIPDNQNPKYFIAMEAAKANDSDVPLPEAEGLHLTGTAQDVDIASYRLTVDGLVDTPLVLSYEEILQFPPVTQSLDLVCPGFFVDYAEWTGVPVTDLLNIAGIKPGASELVFYALDGYQQALSLEDAQQDGVFLAYEVNGQVLPKEHGYPLRLVADVAYGNSWVKWVNRIEVK
jgi:DMSO/TMAO reductase YedYZ molybdopterin-dependent catalytic subunit